VDAAFVIRKVTELFVLTAPATVNIVVNSTAFRKILSASIGAFVFIANVERCVGTVCTT